jgi:hypothetical protein
MNSRRVVSSLIALSLTAGVGLTASGCYRTEQPPDTRSTTKKADADWFNEKAVALKGNFDGLTPEEKQRAIQFRNGSEAEARTGFAMAGKYGGKK